MSDENSTQVWVAQTSQNNQAWAQSDNDFVLDFWDEETENKNANTFAEWEMKESNNDEESDTESIMDNTTETDLNLSQNSEATSEDWETPSESVNESNFEDNIQEENISTQEVESNTDENTSDDDFSLTFDTDTTSDTDTISDSKEENIDTNDTNEEMQTSQEETQSSQEDSPEEVDNHVEDDELFIPDDMPIMEEENTDKEDNSNETEVWEENQDNQILQQDAILSNNELESPDGESQLLNNDSQDNQQSELLEWNNNSDTFLNDNEEVGESVVNEANSPQDMTELFKEDVSSSSTDNETSWEENKQDVANIPNETVDFSENNSPTNDELNENKNISYDLNSTELESDTQLNSWLSDSSIEIPQTSIDNQTTSDNYDDNKQATQIENALNSNDTTSGDTTNVESSVEPTSSMEMPISETTTSNMPNDQQPEALDANGMSDNYTNQAEAINSVTETTQQPWEEWEIRSTLSLDQILDSELMSNPKFTDTSKATPNNVPAKQSSGHSRMVWVIAWILIFLMAWFVVTLAFPSLGINWNFLGNVDEGISKTDPTVSDEDITDTDYQESDQDDTLEFWFVDDIEDDSHGTSLPTFEVPEDTVDDETDSGLLADSEGWEYVEWIDDTPFISPYVYVEDDYVEDVDNKNLSLDYISSQILTFKSQGDNYYSIGVNDSNEKIIKYALYIQYLCNDYQSQIDSGNGLDEESWNSFESDVNKFLTKIDRELGWTNEVETIYAHQVNSDNINDEEKEAMREYLTTR